MVYEKDCIVPLLIFPANTFLWLFGCNSLASNEIKQLYPPKDRLKTVVSNGTMQSSSTTL